MPRPRILAARSVRGRNRRFARARKHERRAAGLAPILSTYSTRYSRGIGYATRGRAQGKWRGCPECAGICATAAGLKRTIEGAAGVLRERAAKASTLGKDTGGLFAAVIIVVLILCAIEMLK